MSWWVVLYCGALLVVAAVLVADALLDRTRSGLAPEGEDGDEAAGPSAPPALTDRERAHLALREAARRAADEEGADRRA